MKRHKDEASTAWATYQSYRAESARTRRKPRIRALVFSIPATAILLVAAACTSSATGDVGTHSQTSPASEGAKSSAGNATGVVRFAEPPASGPTWILPITPPGHNATANTYEFSYLMWRPLYWQGSGTSPSVDFDISLAPKPTYSDNNSVVTIHLRDYNWSDGKPVTSRDVEFFYNLVRFDPANWSYYVKGNFPDNVKQFTVIDSKTFKLTLTKSVSPTWFTSNQLSLITPLPQHAWDKTSSTGSVGNLDESEAGAKAVLKYLIGEAKDVADYSTNELWKTVDGPWTLKTYSSNGQIAFIPNGAYTGPVKPTYAEFDEVPFTTDAAIFNAVLANQVDYGRIPLSSVKEIPRVKALGYHVIAWDGWGLNYIALNYYAQSTGKIVSQLYVRRALESMVNQPAIIKNIFSTYGSENFAAIPPAPANPYSTIKANPNLYDPAKAVSLLKEHGWDVRPGGQTTCAKPGTGENECGAGIAAGTPLKFEIIVNNTNAPVDLEMQELKSEWSKDAGIVLNVHLEPFSQVISDAFAACTKDNPSGCPWQLADWGGGYPLPQYPTGEQIFASGGGGNAGHYSDPKADKLIDATHLGGSDALKSYDSYITEQIPEIWLPSLPNQVSAISDKLTGADEQNVFTAITPEAWHITS